MNQFVLQQGVSAELRLFPHILEMGLKKNGAIRLNAFPTTTTEGIRIYHIIDGRFEWCIDRQSHVFYPGDVALVMPGKTFGCDKGTLEIGTFTWIHLHMQKSANSQMLPGTWSGLSESESTAIGKILSLNRTPALSGFSEAGKIFKCIRSELFGQEIGHQARINHQVTELLIQATRQLTRQSYSGRDFPKIFMDLEKMLRQNLAHQWSVEEMAAMVGMSTTPFNERVKSYSGFTPINYLINIRISEAIKLLKRPEISVTDIALDTGFYSSQHFSTTFKRLTGFTPSEYRKNHLRNK
jgi:AraC-like DNA-binding protein